MDFFTRETGQENVALIEHIFFHQPLTIELKLDCFLSYKTVLFGIVKRKVSNHDTGIIKHFILYLYIILTLTIQLASSSVI